MNILREYQSHLTNVANGRGRLYLTVSWSQDRPGGEWEAEVYSVRDKQQSRHVEEVCRERNKSLIVAVDRAVESAKKRIDELWSKEPYE